MLSSREGIVVTCVIINLVLLIFGSVGSLNVAGLEVTTPGTFNFLDGLDFLFRLTFFGIPGAGVIASTMFVAMNLLIAWEIGRMIRGN